jgi:hypothetical protein
MDECEEERLLGPDDDTLVQPWCEAKATAKDLQLGEGEE